MRHGDVRVALLLALVEGQPGYENRAAPPCAPPAARGNPNPGSIYPTLQSLADEDLRLPRRARAKRVYASPPAAPPS